MNISFREVKKDSLDDFILISKWNNDASIKHFVTPNFTGGDLPDSTPEQLLENALNKSATHFYIILADDIAVGEFSIQIDPPQLHKKIENTGWIGITIGEEKYRGRGIGSAAIKFMEDKCRELDLVRIELGVFAFNHNAIRSYLNAGYKEFAVLKDFTYNDGKWHDDIRMEKYLRD